MESKYIKTDIGVSSIKYHFIFCPRYRKKIFLDNKLEQRFIELVTIICRSIDVKIVTIKCESDTVKITVMAVPTLSPLDIMNKIRRGTNGELRQEFKQLEKIPTVWTKKFFVSTEDEIDSESIKKYVDSQKKK